MNHLLDNPVYHALLTGDKHLSLGAGNVKFFDEAVSPFAGFDDNYSLGFDDLFALLPPGRRILYATPRHIPQPEGWQLLHKVPGIQMIFTTAVAPVQVAVQPVPLQEQHIAQVLALAKLTKPGPFGLRTIEFGHYFGIFKEETLVAMTGQRLHVEQFTEISAVCTHPDHLGRGYATALVQHQVNLILQEQQTPFLHVRADNQRAIDVYQRMGFVLRSPMNFYFMERKNRKGHSL